VKEGYEISGRGIGVTVVDDVVVIPCELDRHCESLEGYNIRTGEKLWEVTGRKNCNKKYVMGSNKMLYALRSYHDHGTIELYLTEQNPFTGEVDLKVIKEGLYWGHVINSDVTVHSNKLFYINRNTSEGFPFGVINLDTKEVIEDFALKPKGYHVEKPIVTDEKIYVLIYGDKKNELRIYENEYK